MSDNDSYELVQLANGSFSIRSRSSAEIFHPIAGPAAEAEALYVRQLRLADRMRECSGEFVIWDVGLGAAANPITALQCTRDLSTAVRIVSFDVTTAALSFALEHTSALPYLRGFEKPLNDLIARGQSRLDNRPVEWTLHQGDFPALMRTTAAKRATGDTALFPSPHVIFFDAFSPARNPEMWTLSLLTDIRSQLVEPCVLATFSRSTMARTGLLLAGFFVGSGEPVAGKEETTVAANAPSLVPHLLDKKWLERARRSHGAEPLYGRVYQQRPLSAENWEKLKSHPQFTC